jgi:hypothetical protein
MSRAGLKEKSLLYPIAARIVKKHSFAGPGLEKVIRDTRYFVGFYSRRGQIMKMGKALAALSFAALFGCSGAAPRYEFSFTEASGEKVAWGSFEGSDKNKDGAIEKSELTAFKEEVSVYSYPNSRNDWAEGFESGDFPKIVHDLADLKEFSYRAADAKSKKAATLEFKTNSSKDHEAKGFFFWRGLESAEGGGNLTFFDGVSDGSKGLEVNMTDRGESDSLKLTVTYKK